MEHAWLTAGLGNTGKAYRRTRHNVGFMVVEDLAGRWDVLWAEQAKFKSRLAMARQSVRRVFLCQPLTYMNTSGSAVESATRFYRIPAEQVMVVVDDADLPFGEIRMRPGGGTGGHHGLESVQSCLGTQAFARLRIGIGRGEEQHREITDYVLAPFGREELGLLKKVLERAADQLECWLEEGLQQAMNRYNGLIEH